MKSDSQDGLIPGHTTKPVHGAPHAHNVPADLKETAPIPCTFRQGDRVLFTNDYGAQFELTVKGFAAAPHTADASDPDPRFIYIFDDAWWFPVRAGSLRLIERPRAAGRM